MKKAKPSTRIKYCNTLEEVKELVSYIKTTKVCSFDFETNGRPFYELNAYPTILGVSFQPGSAYIIPLGHHESPHKENWLEILQYFGREVMMDPDIIKIAHNLKFEWRWMKQCGIDMVGRLYDNMLAKYLLDENSPNGLKEVVSDMLPKYSGYDDELDILLKKHGGKNSNGWENVPLKPLSEYCGMDCDMTLRLMTHFHTKLIKHNFYKLFRNLLMMATRVLAESEWHGIHVDSEYLDKVCDQYQAKIDDELDKLRSHPRLKKFSKANREQKVKSTIKEIKQEIEVIKESNKPNAQRLIDARYLKIKNIVQGVFTNKKDRKLDEPFNFGSPKQLVELFYTSKYGFRFPKQTKLNRKTGQLGYTTDEAAIDKLQTMDIKGKKFLKQLLEFRGLQKLHSTYMIGIRDALDHENLLHPDFHLLTVTGRLGCREPNMQNVPRVTTNKDVKPMFLPLNGLLHYEVDYSQAELRVVAELAKDKAMIDIFKRGYNIHVATACLVNGRLDDYDEIRKIIKDEHHPENLKWEKEKKKAKTINFGILYGQSADKLAEGMGVSLKEAQQFIKKWLNAYPQVKRWIARQKATAKEHGYVMSIFGRKRRLPDIWDDRVGVRSAAEREAVNAPIQGSASDYTQVSAIELRRLRLMGELPAYFVQRITVHDSIEYYMHPDDIHWINPMVVKVCSNPNTLEYFGFEMKYVNMKVSAEIGVNWGNMKELELDSDIPKLLESVYAKAA